MKLLHHQMSNEKRAGRGVPVMTDGRDAAR